MWSQARGMFKHYILSSGKIKSLAMQYTLDQTNLRFNLRYTTKCKIQLMEGVNSLISLQNCDIKCLQSNKSEALYLLLCIWKNVNFAHNRKTLPNFIIVTYPPIFESPQPPGQALTNDGSARSATGLNVPVLKYGPTGDKITYNRADKDLLTPRAGWKRERAQTLWSTVYFEVIYSATNLT